METENKNLQANSRSACQLRACYKREKDAYRLLAKLRICSLAKGVEIELVCSGCGHRFPTCSLFKIPILGHETWPLAKVTHVLSFHHMRSKLSLFTLCRQRFPRYSQIFKISVFGHETWPRANVPSVAHVLFSTTEGQHRPYFCSTEHYLED